MTTVLPWPRVTGRQSKGSQVGAGAGIDGTKPIASLSNPAANGYGSSDSEKIQIPGDMKMVANTKLPSTSCFNSNDNEYLFGDGEKIQLPEGIKIIAKTENASARCIAPASNEYLFSDVDKIKLPTGIKIVTPDKAKKPEEKGSPIPGPFARLRQRQAGSAFHPEQSVLSKMMEAFWYEQSLLEQRGDKSGQPQGYSKIQPVPVRCLSIHLLQTVPATAKGHRIPVLLTQEEGHESSNLSILYSQTPTPSPRSRISTR